MRKKTYAIVIGILLLIFSMIVYSVGFGDVAASIPIFIGIILICFIFYNE